MIWLLVPLTLIWFLAMVPVAIGAYELWFFAVNGSWLHEVTADGLRPARLLLTFLCAMTAPPLVIGWFEWHDRRQRRGRPGGYAP